GVGPAWAKRSGVHIASGGSQMALASTGPAVTYTSPKRRPYRVQAVIYGGMRRSRSTRSASAWVRNVSLAKARTSTAAAAATCPSVSLTASLTTRSPHDSVNGRRLLTLWKRFPIIHRRIESRQSATGRYGAGGAPG